MKKQLDLIDDVLYAHRRTIIIGLIVLTGFLLRFWGIWNLENQDEYREVLEALRVCSGKLNLERWSKRFYLYVLSIFYGAYFAVGWLIDVFASPADFAAKVVRDMDPLLVIARLVNVLFGTASIIVTYLIGRTLYGVGVGILAALLLCFNPLHVEYSHYAMVDASLCFNVLVAFYFLAKIISDDDNRNRYYLLAGLFAGIAFQNKAPAIVLIVSFLAVHLLIKRKDSLAKILFGKEIVTYGLAYIGGLVVGNPAVLLAPVSFVKSFFGYTGAYTTAINLVEAKSIGYAEYLAFFYDEYGILLLAVIIYSVARTCFSKKSADILVASFVVPYYLMMGASRYMVYSRYMLPIVPFLFVMAASKSGEFINRLEWLGGWPRRALVYGALLLLMLPSLDRLVAYEVEISGPDTKTLAAEWINANIPAGSKILMDAGKTFNTNGPKIAENAVSIERTIEQGKEDFQSEAISKQRYESLKKYYKMRLKTVPEISFDITSTRNGTAVESIDFYIENGFDYFIITESIKDRASSELIKSQLPTTSRFYESLDTDKRVRLIKRFVPTKTNRGHEYSIYRLERPAE